MKRQLLIAIALISAMTIAAPAAATPIIDFSGQLGLVTIAPGGISGSITISSVLLQDTPNYMNNAFPVLDGSLVFDSTGAVPNFRIWGSIPALGIMSTVELLTGSIAGWDLDAQNKVLHIYGPDAKHGSLLTAAGLPAGTQFAYFGSDLYGNLVPGTRDTFYATSVDVRNEAVPDAGSSLLLLGMGLVGLKVWRKR